MPSPEVVTIGLVVFVGLVALVIDRRALLASAISYLGIAIGVLLVTINLGEAITISLTLLLPWRLCADAGIGMELPAP